MKITFNCLTFLLIANLSYAQSCKTEAEVPSTTPNSRFIDNGDGTISDADTDLMWQKCQLGLSGSNCSSDSATWHTWQEALDEADSNTLAGYDWRLPNHKELLSIVEQRCIDPSINKTYFPNTSTLSYWTSSPYIFENGYSWGVHFNSSGSSKAYNNSHLFVRLVRSIK